MAKRSTAGSPQHYLKQLTQSFLAHLANAQSGNPVATHQLRVYGRRLRVALPLLARKPEGGRVRRAHRMVRDRVRSAGASRDRDVMLELLQDDLARDRGQNPASGQLHNRLRNSARRARKRLTTIMPVEDVHRLHAALWAACERPVGLDVALQRVSDQHQKLHKTQRKTLKKLGRHFDPVRLHALRRSLRRLRYTAEVQDQLTGRSSGVVETLKKLQDRLGHLHDCWVLAEWFRGQAESGVGHRPPAFRHEARHRARRALQTARRQHRKWLDEHPAQQLESVYWSLSVAGSPDPRNSGQAQ